MTSLSLYVGCRRISSVTSVVIVIPGEHIRFCGAQVIFQVVFRIVVPSRRCICMQYDCRESGTGVFKPFSKHLRFRLGIVPLVSKAKAYGIPDIGKKSFLQQIPITRRVRSGHIINPSRRLGKPPVAVWILLQVSQVVLGHVIKQGAVPAKLLRLLGCGHSAPISLTGHPAQNGKSPLYNRGLSGGQILMALLMLPGNAAICRRVIGLGRRRRILVDHKLMNL